MLKLVMNKWTMAITLGLLLITYTDNAFSRDIIVKIKATKTSKLTKVLGMKTFSGQSIAVKMIKGMKNKLNIKASVLMKKPQIELKNGEIIYPEEINFFFSKKKMKTNSLKVKKSKFTFRAPEGDD